MKRKYRWELREADERETAALASALKVPPLIARLLVSRGRRTPEEALAFLYADETSFHDPYLMKGMAGAAERIRRAIRDGERIRVYGDYDADGVTSTALMIRLLGRLGGDYDTYIPHRSREGYGLNIPAIDKAIEAGVRLIVTVDNGISAVEPIAYARERGLDVVVTDHHEPPAILPEANVLVNPKQEDCGYPFKGLSGAGVAFKLAQAMLGRPDLTLADVAAIGTVADLMPLEDENRALVRLGLEQMAKQPSPGIRALAAVCGAEPDKLSSGRIGFGLAPRLNAGGRLESADPAVRLLVTDSGEEAEELAARLDSLNRERQQLVDDTLLEAEAMWQRKLEANGGRMPEAIVLAGEGWNAGIAGLVASKLVERYYRPAFVLAYDAGSEKCKGSARSIDGFDLHAALTDCAELMEHFGGHQAAAGLTIRLDRLPELEARLCRLAAERIAPADWIPKRKADLIVPVSELTLETADLLKQLEPFGNGNPTPKFALRGVAVGDKRLMGKDNRHLRLVAEERRLRIEAVGFGMAEDAAALEKGAVVDLLGELAVNEWNGSRRVQFMLLDWRHHSIPVYDRRGEKRWLQAIESLAAAEREVRWLVLCGSHAVWSEAQASEKLAACGALAARFGDWEQIPTALRPSAAGEIAAGAAAELAGVQLQPMTLALAELPEQPEAAQAVGRLLASGYPFEAVYLFDASGAGDIPGAGRRSGFPDREQFGRVYSLFRRQGSWIDTPDGFLRQVSGDSGWPLSVVRMMQEVFEELGFLTVDRSNVKVVSAPPRRELEHSARFRKAKEHAELLSLRTMDGQELRRWIERQLPRQI
ncbi:single-stranded-DNA-specific exonuclease RecJ [Cohnella lubricantis]|uniref:Single-stranded-DNA-specific exonuclease RecJ n=1 Tax=Cohnella lubricantis TaxID=2163172 RepID=A0A841TEA1_9BACL|nr:single-stranded-DNA-specific exonuclease RecJ [Cohnella lubricantis]MBB6677648.1 single-stranded-DNA-specific exonuclease RecJ [Cohnella lubricantis]MBP2116464.1 single-stranded-DNA-specific exonuclease [Cohnella lubricantis]